MRRTLPVPNFLQYIRSEEDQDEETGVDHAIGNSERRGDYL
ncbi:MAG: hypothetical protein ABEI52_06905 [Halobacteriaceae archaeon]